MCKALLCSPLLLMFGLSVKGHVQRALVKFLAQNGPSEFSEFQSSQLL